MLFCRSLVGQLVNSVQTGAVSVCRLGASVLLVILTNYILDMKSDCSFSWIDSWKFPKSIRLTLHDHLGKELIYSRLATGKWGQNQFGIKENPVTFVADLSKKYWVYIFFAYACKNNTSFRVVKNLVLLPGQLKANIGHWQLLIIFTARPPPIRHITPKQTQSRTVMCLHIFTSPVVLISQTASYQVKRLEIV